MKNILISLGMLGAVAGALTFFVNCKNVMPFLFGATFSESDFPKTCLWLDGLLDSIRVESESGNEIRVNTEVRKLRNRLSENRNRKISWELQVARVSRGRIYLNASYLVVDGELKAYENLMDQFTMFGAMFDSNQKTTLITLSPNNTKSSNQGLSPGFLSFPVRDLDRPTAVGLKRGDRLRISGQLKQIHISKFGFRMEMEDVKLQAR